MKLRCPQIRWRWPTVRELGVGIPAVLVTIVFIVLFARNADTVAFPDYEVPEGFVPAPAPTTTAPGATLPTLAAVAGTTTTLVPGIQGTAVLQGVVTGPGGPVGGAMVRIERSVRGQMQRLDVVTGAEGGWVVPGLNGGAYRVRAFLPPALAQRSASVFFLGAGETRDVDLSLESFAEPAITIAVAPNPPLLDQPLNLAVQVTSRTVDGDGIVRAQPLVGATVAVSVTGGWQRDESTTTTSTSTSSTTSSTTSTTTFGTTTTTTTEPSSIEPLTDAGGQVTIGFTCRAAGPVQVTVTVRPSDGAPSTTAVLAAPDCIDPATTSTASTAPPSTTAN